MKRTLLALAIASLPLSTATAANCAGTGATQIDPSTLSGSTVCGSANGESWQEYHIPGGSLKELAKGENDPVDPSHVVGSWTVNGQVIEYDYGSGGVFGYELWQNTSTRWLCGVSGGAPNVMITVVAGENGCLAAPL